MAGVLMCDRCGSVGPADTFKAAIVGYTRTNAQWLRLDPLITNMEVCPACALVIRQVMVDTEYVRNKKP